MKTFRLLVKGRRDEALKACEIRNIKAYLSVMTYNSPSRGHTVVYAQADEREVARWFCEPENYLPEYGYVDGTLLHYNEPKKFKQALGNSS